VEQISFRIFAARNKLIPASRAVLRERLERHEMILSKSAKIAALIAPSALLSKWR
jgi:hypothetical protein